MWDCVKYCVVSEVRRDDDSGRVDSTIRETVCGIVCLSALQYIQYSTVQYVLVLGSGRGLLGVYRNAS